MAWLASACLVGDARLRHAGRYPSPCQQNIIPKNESQDQRTIAQDDRFLIRWSIQEIRRIAVRLERRRIKPAHIIAWSLWRRAHQAAARLFGRPLLSPVPRHILLDLSMNKFSVLDRNGNIHTGLSAILSCTRPLQRHLCLY